MFTSSYDAFRYLEDFTNFEKTHADIRNFRLDRMGILLDSFSNPESSFKSVHVAGSKGKGTTAAFTASIIEKAGIKTGLYTSPHIIDYRERITCAGTFFPEEIYIEGIKEIYNFIESGNLKNLPVDPEPTTFELLTLLAFLIFRSTGCRAAVIETGIGGRLDATNLVNPELSVITNIEYEHTAILGDSITSIAGEKAGIIKEGKPVVAAVENSDAMEIIVQTCSQKKSRLFDILGISDGESFLNDDFSSQISLKIRLPNADKNLDLEFKSQFSGPYAKTNAAAAVVACLIFDSSITPEIIIQGLESAKLKARNELWNIDRKILFDGAHTVKSVKSLMISVKKRFSDGGTVIFGVASDKDGAAISEMFCGWAKEIIITSPGFFKKSNPELLFKQVKNKNICKTSLFINPADAVQYLFSQAVSPVLVTGSFYLVSEVQKKIVDLYPDMPLV